MLGVGELVIILIIAYYEERESPLFLVTARKRVSDRLQILLGEAERAASSCDEASM